ncbi:MAG: tyrosine-type recombinase/integrase [Catenulisporales bacterium]|nr:tyrosine-type recombinase/integrase [Catenulisporales bacterium]
MLRRGTYRLLEQDVDNSEVQEILGHSTATATRKYTHVTKKLHDTAADSIGRVPWAN